MPWFGSRLQDVVDFLLVVKERNMRERARKVTDAFEYLLSLGKCRITP